VDGAALSETDDVAIVGMACRFPGANDVDALWRNLVAGRCAVRTYSEAELRAAGIGEELLRDPRYVRAAGHLDGYECFDADFFGVSPREAQLMDPQHRLFLEVSWTALEDAGCDPGRYRGTTGVFAGAGANRYFLCNLFGNPRAGLTASAGDVEGQLAPGFASDHLPMRVSHRLGLTGPSVAVQTACSTSLVAVCLAAQSLRDYRCDMAIAGGASLAATRACGYRETEATTAVPDGRCRAFDARAAGAAPGSGAGAVVLKRLEDAVTDGDQVLAVMRGWAVNNDGADRAGYAAPSASGQAAVVVEALSAAGVESDTIGYVEAHGSGTPVGDAIEVDALTRAFRRRTARTGCCALGSVKTALGNLDAAAGVASLIKAVLAVRHGAVPPSPYFERPNPEIDLAASPFFVNREVLTWAGEPRRAGVSSFGLGGTNAHVVLEQTPGRAPSGPSRPDQLLALSARTPDALGEVAARLRRHLAAHPDLMLADVAYTLGVGRRPFPHRAAMTCSDPGQAVAALAELPPPSGELARLWAAGGDLDWARVFAGERRHRVSLPTYPFERRRHWIERCQT
jgi:acyl transferase domain-containing protein